MLVVVCDVLCSVNDEECCGGNIVVLIFLVVVRFILFVDERVVGLNGECIWDCLKLIDKGIKKKKILKGGNGGIGVRGERGYCILFR